MLHIQVTYVENLEFVTLTHPWLRPTHNCFANEEYGLEKERDYLCPFLSHTSLLRTIIMRWTLGRKHVNTA